MSAKRILFVEDDAALRGALHDAFAHKGYEMLEAENGKLGLQIALAEHPDLILLDIIMPEMDGMTMLKKLREDAWGKTAEVILLSNISNAEKVAEALDLGVYEYFVKADQKLENIIERVGESLSRKK